MTLDRTRLTVALLGAQALWFGIAEALLLIPANAVFLDAYGAEWLPLTYIGIAALGTAASLVIARALRRWTLPTVAVATLGTTAATVLATWAVTAATGAAWPAAVQLLVFPILIQVGFVIIGGQAGRLLDLQQIKQHFPRIVAGFVVGFMLGGFAAAPLLEVLGAPEHLVVVSAASFVVFMVLVRVTARRRPAELTTVDRPSDDRPRPPLRALLGARLVVLVFAYQVLSAIGSQVLEFLAFDRAAARYEDADDLTRFLAVYTGVLNLVDLVFVAVVAGWLLRRYGLRLGLSANPAVVTVLAAAMVLAAAGPGAASFAMFFIATSARVADIALTDGTTRTSINAVYQVLPVEERVAVQASVEGVGVPVAIGATGVLLIVMNALDLGAAAIALFALVLSTVWTAAAFVVYADYRRALVARLRRRGFDLRAVEPRTAEEQTAVRSLLLTDDVRDVRLGLDLAVTASLSPADLAHLAEHDDADVRLLALGQLARRGDTEAARAAATAASDLATSSAAAERRAAALALGDVDVDVDPPRRHQLVRALLHDEDLDVRLAALASVRSGDAELVTDVDGLLGDAATAMAAHDALVRLGAPALTLVAARLANGGSQRPRDVRLVRSAHADTDDAVACLTALVTHADRAVSVAALTALSRHGRRVDDAVLDGLLATDAALAARVLAATAAMGPDDTLVTRALSDVLVSLRDRVLAVLAVRHGAERMESARNALRSPDPARRALGVEVLLVSLPRGEVVLVEPVVRDDLSIAERRRRLRAAADVPARDRTAWLADLALDPDGGWSSPWLQAVALHAERHSDPATAAHHAGSIGHTGDPVLAETVAAVTGA